MRKILPLRQQCYSGLPLLQRRHHHRYSAKKQYLPGTDPPKSFKVKLFEEDYSSMSEEGLSIVANA